MYNKHFIIFMYLNYLICSVKINLFTVPFFSLPSCQCYFINSLVKSLNSVLIILSTSECPSSQPLIVFFILFYCVTVLVVSSICSALNIIFIPAILKLVSHQTSLILPYQLLLDISPYVLWLFKMNISETELLLSPFTNKKTKSSTLSLPHSQTHLMATPSLSLKLKSESSLTPYFLSHPISNLSGSHTVSVFKT